MNSNTLPFLSGVAGISYLGPATVLAVEPGRVHLECPDAYPWARLAITPTYEPVPGDVVLAIGSGENWYIIGVLEGRGATRLTALGDLVLAAPFGRVEIAASEEVAVHGKRLRFSAVDIEVTARHLLQRVQSLTQWVTGALHQRAGRVVAVIEGAFHLKAARIAQRAEGDVKVNGRSIHLN